MSSSETTTAKQSVPTTPQHSFAVLGTGRVTPFHCPCCKEVNLEVGKLGAVEVCHCVQCGSFVLDNATCGSLINELRSGYEGPDEKPVLMDPRQLEMKTHCPACGDPMEVHPYYGPGNVVIDSCLHCKLVWFNAGELDRIIRAPGLRKQSVGSFRPADQNLSQAGDYPDQSGLENGLAAGSLTVLDIAATVVRALFR